MGNIGIPILALALAGLIAIFAYRFRFFPNNSVFQSLQVALRLKEKDIIPISVNYFFTRHCNADCGFCFHTETTSYKLPLSQAQNGMSLLAASGMKKMNFAGGEPFLYPKYLGALCKYCKEDLKLESVSIVSNGTKVTEKWIKEFGMYVDILAISCDSMVMETNEKIGRKDRGTTKGWDNVGRLFEIKEWCRENGIRFKLNTVVCSLNWQEDMADMVQKLDPFRWKVFQVLVVVGQNESDDRKRNATMFIVTDEQYKDFCQRHRHLKCMIPEPNKVMKSSYLQVDEYMRFLDKGDGVETTSECILDIGVQKAIRQVTWDQEEFRNRGGVYDWNSASEKATACGSMGKDKILQW